MEAAGSAMGRVPMAPSSAKLCHHTALSTRTGQAMRFAKLGFSQSIDFVAMSKHKGCAAHRSSGKYSVKALQSETLPKKEIVEDVYGGLSQVCAVLGTQWGDEGKGKLVDILSRSYDVVARCQVLVENAFWNSEQKG